MTNFLSAIRTYAFKVALMAAKRQLDQLPELRQLGAQLILDVDPDQVDYTSADFRYGAFLAITTFLHAFESQTLSTKTRKLLLKSQRARIVNGLLAYSYLHLNQKDFGEKLGIHASHLTRYLQELTEENLIESVPLPKPTLGRTYQITDWGRRVWKDMIAELPPEIVPPHELTDAKLAYMGVPTGHSDPEQQLDLLLDSLTGELLSAATEPATSVSKIGLSYLGEVSSPTQNTLDVNLDDQLVGAK